MVFEEGFEHDLNLPYNCDEYLHQKIRLHQTPLGYMVESIGYLREWEIAPFGGSAFGIPVATEQKFLEEASND